MRERKAELHEARVEAIHRLTEAVARHKARGDFIQAEIFAELLVEAQDRLANSHIIVGDHTPEPRVTDEMHAGLGWKHLSEVTL